MNTEFARRGGYPLVALFALVAACAAIFGLVSPVIPGIADGSVTWIQLGGVILYGTIISMILGLCVGRCHHRQPFGSLLGLLLGLLLGPCTSAVTLVPVHQIAALFWAAIGGSVLLVIFGVTVRMNTRLPQTGFHNQPIEATIVEDNESQPG